SLRDQLTVLHDRQQKLTDEFQQALPPADKPNAKLELKNRIPKRVALATDLAEETSQMFDNYVVWTPLNQDVNKGKLAQFKAKGVKLLASANDLLKQAGDESASKAIATAEAFHDQLVDWETTLPELLTGDVDPKLQAHVVNRVQEAQKLITK